MDEGRHFNMFYYYTLIFNVSDQMLNMKPLHNNYVYSRLRPVGGAKALASSKGTFNQNLHF